MRVNQFVPGYVSQAVKVESKFTDYELAIMEGGLSLDKPKSALHQAVTNEGFDQPYPLTWEDSEFGDIDALARLPDGSNLSIMFNKQQGDEGEESVQVEFYRNNSQEVTGEGDAQRVFATVLTAIQQYIKKHNPLKLTFSASKDVDPDQNSESRAKLYDRLVQRYSRTWGYRAFRADTGKLVVYELSRIKPVAENFADGKVKGKSRPGRVKRSGASCDGSVTDLRQKAKDASGERAKMYHWCANMKSSRAKNESEILEDLEEGWKDWVAGAALGAAALSPQAADAKSSPQQKPAITQQVQGDANYATKLILKPEAKILIQTARAAGMRGKELAQFVAQCAHETANFSSLKELGGRLDFKKYDPKHNPRKAKMLGNKQVGDGAKYHGRGYIQLTGRDNYKRAGQALGLPLEEQPELVERPDIAAKVAVWFWQNQVAPKVNNFSDTAQVTKPINSGLKGLDDRHNKFASIMALMGSKS
jgi:predicted chitinase